MAETILVRVNGVDQELDSGTTIAGLLEQMNLNGVTVVAMRNDEIVERDLFSNTMVMNGDVVELVAFVRGG